MDLDQIILVEAQKANSLQRFALTEAAHRYGINCRHFGRLRSLVKTPEFKTVILAEMVAR